MERFKKGTKVVCLDSSVSSFTKGTIYEVSKVSNLYLHFYKFIPVSELEPFAVIAENREQLKEICDYKIAMFGFSGIASSVDIEGQKVALYFMENGYWDRPHKMAFPNIKTLTFKQFKNNEHLMSTTKLSGTVYPTDCCGVSNGLVVSPDFVKKAHRAACADWKKKIEKQFPSLFPKPVFKIGDRLRIDGDTGWLLTAVDYLKCAIVNVNNGHHLGIPFSVKDITKVQTEEIGQPNYKIEKHEA
jgi:hypothetical protein